MARILLRSGMGWELVLTHVTKRKQTVDKLKFPTGHKALDTMALKVFTPLCNDLFDLYPCGHAFTINETIGNLPSIAKYAARTQRDLIRVTLRHLIHESDSTIEHLGSPSSGVYRVKH